MTLGSLRLFRLSSVLVTGVLALPALAADRKAVPPGAPTINKQSSLATRQASLNPNRQVTDASKRQIAGHRRPAAGVRAGGLLVQGDELLFARTRDRGWRGVCSERADGRAPHPAGGDAGTRDQLEG